jgi:hypothetical protein
LSQDGRNRRRHEVAGGGGHGVAKGVFSSSGFAWNKRKEKEREVRSGWRGPGIKVGERGGSHGEEKLGAAVV